MLMTLASNPVPSHENPFEIIGLLWALLTIGLPLKCFPTNAELVVIPYLLALYCILGITVTACCYLWRRKRLPTLFGLVLPALVPAMGFGCIALALIAPKPDFTLAHANIAQWLFFLTPICFLLPLAAWLVPIRKPLAQGDP